MTAGATTVPRLADVHEAAGRIASHVRRTPLLRIAALPGILLKAEHLQRSGSFKARGACNAMLARHAKRVVTGSSGNHGLAVAALGAAAGAHVTVVMAADASAAKATAIGRLGAEVVFVAGGVADRERHARDLARAAGAIFMPSSDDELVVAGQGSVALEVFADAPGLDAIYVPTGGGGLLAGTCLAACSLNRAVKVIGVEPAAGPRYARSLAAGRPVTIPPPDTIADGLRGQRPGEVPFAIISRRADALISVSDDAISQATELLRSHGIAAEPSGGVALAGALESGFAGQVAVVVSGGNTPASLARTFPAPLTQSRKGRSHDRS
ncbi:MAG TPA: pyridoxal-phosphate dependent enzyme [Streptosporangiaceae bacterium]|nr:pyridoxal-phosphate dependent enzyme [Streptosporangiaceae bacterium]